MSRASSVDSSPLPLRTDHGRRRCRAAAALEQPLLRSQENKSPFGIKPRSSILVSSSSAPDTGFSGYFRVPGLDELFPVSSMISITAGSMSLIRPPGGTSSCLSRRPSRHSSALCMTADMRRLDALLLPDLHLPALGPELPRQWQIKRHPSPLRIMSLFSVHAKGTFWPWSASSGASMLHLLAWPFKLSFNVGIPASRSGLRIASSR